MIYKTKPVEIEAFEWDGTDAVIKWANNRSDGAGTSLCYMAGYISGEGRPRPPVLVINTLEGQMRATIGDFVICGLHGEFYFCKPEIFHKKYEAVK